jgi:two-component system sensor histidine kinase PhoQ
MVAGSNDGLRVPRALGTRVLAASMGLLVLFLGLTFAGLDLAFRRAASQALEDVLDSQVLGLLAAADEASGHGLELPTGLPETRLSRPGSGLYGRVATPEGETVWVSRSALGLTLPPSDNLDPGRPEYRSFTLADGDEIMLVDLRVEWEFEDGVARDFVFTVASSMGSYRAQVARYRARLGGWFALMTVLMGAAQLVILRFVLRPLRQAEREVEEIETGLRERLSGGYPAELEALARNVNELIEGERARSTRYRESLDNLAHSLKTPLAVVRSQIEATGPIEERAELVIEQVERMQGIVDYQLRRAAAGSAAGSARVNIEPVAEATLAALRKVYAERPIEVSARVQPGATFRGERGDLAEILGNLLDNAFKWCQGKIRLEVRQLRSSGRRPDLEIVVEDDGPGLDPTRAQSLIRRGERGDEAVPGQGIGLAVVSEIVGARGGALEFGASAMGGARVVVRLPGEAARPLA